ncbi:MAG TPA: hypothetical protein VFP52_05000 [Myxococcales bacterium]|nr:hypothetical protein [Myxococcales bacterium]
MQKVVLMSILAVTIILPALAARDPDPRVALRKAIRWTLVGIFAYVAAVLLVYPRLVG